MSSQNVSAAPGGNMSPVCTDTVASALTRDAARSVPVGWVGAVIIFSVGASAPSRAEQPAQKRLHVRSLEHVRPKILHCRPAGAALRTLPEPLRPVPWRLPPRPGWGWDTLRDGPHETGSPIVVCFHSIPPSSAAIRVCRFSHLGSPDSPLPFPEPGTRRSAECQFVRILEPLQPSGDILALEIGIPGTYRHVRQGLHPRHGAGIFGRAMGNCAVHRSIGRVRTRPWSSQCGRCRRAGDHRASSPQTGG